AATVVALPLFAFTIFTTNGVFEGRTDQLAWCPFVFAACRVVEDAVSGRMRSARGRVLTGALFALSALAQQTTLSACAVAILVGLVVGIVGERRRTTDAKARSARWIALAAALVLALSTVPGAVLAQSKQGGDTNNLAGPVWGFALIIATVLVVSEPVWRTYAM